MNEFYLHNRADKSRGVKTVYFDRETNTNQILNIFPNRLWIMNCRSRRRSSHPNIFTTLAHFCHYAARYETLLIKSTNEALRRNWPVCCNIHGSLLSANSSGLAGNVCLPDQVTFRVFPYVAFGVLGLLWPPELNLSPIWRFGSILKLFQNIPMYK